MLSNPWVYLTLLAFVIIAVLAAIAVKLLRQLKQQTLAQKQKEIAQQQALQQHDKKIIASVIIIVRAMKEEQCDIAEGCWRLSVLLDSYEKVRFSISIDELNSNLLLSLLSNFSVLWSSCVSLKMLSSELL